MILVVSHAADDHAMGVLAEIERAGHPVTMIDTAQFPVHASLTQRFDEGRRHFEYALDGRTVDLDGCGAVWWRRPQPFTLEDGLSPDVISFTYNECHEAVAGLWAALDAAWINPPALDETAHHKPYQLAVAARLGLPIPRTVITNDPTAARRLVAELGPERTVYKTFLASDHCWRETRIMRSDEVALLDRVRLAPVIFQEYVPAVADVRVTVIGKDMFSAAISSAPGAYEVDYRMDLAGARFEPIELPLELQRDIARLMQRLGLIYGAVDLRQTPDGRYVFLEINPAGEWRFVEERTGQPLTAAMATLLIDTDRR